MTETQPTAAAERSVEDTETTNVAEREPRIKTLAVRLDETVHTKLRFIAQLSGTTITDEIRGAIETRIEAAQTDPELAERAERAREEIEREAATRAAAIAGFLGGSAAAASVEASPKRRTRTPKG